MPPERQEGLRGAPLVGPPFVVRVDPGDGARLVLRDTPVLIRLSRPADARSVSTASVRVLDAEGEVPARLGLSADGCVVIWQAERLLVPGIEHVLVSSGLRDARGLAVGAVRTRFVPCSLSRRDLTG